MHTVPSSNAVDRWPSGCPSSKASRWPYAAKGVRGPCVTMTSKEETACRRQPGLRCGCRVHAVSSVDAEVVEAVRKFCIWHNLSAYPRPGGSRYTLAFLTKSDISLHKNTHLRPPSSFNILIDWAQRHYCIWSLRLMVTKFS